MSTALKRIRSRILVPFFLRFLLPVLRALPLRSTVFGPVKRTCPSLAGFIEARQGNSRADHWLRRIGPEIESTNPAPEVASPGLPGNYEQIRVLRCPETYLARLHGGRIATHAMEVISPDDSVFSDLYYTDPSIRPSRSMVTPVLPRMRRKEGTYATISISRPSNYCHWIRDCLTRLWILDTCGVDDFRLIVPRDSRPFQRPLLAMLGFSDDRLVPFGHEHWRVEQLLVPSLTNRHRQAHPEACRWLRERFRAAIAPGPASRRLYVSRALAKKRHVSNESELLELLEPYGFECLQTEIMTAEAQAETFSQAEIVVAPHGAGLANMIFMPEGSLVVEMNHHRRTKASFYSMTTALGLRYAIITNAPETPGDTTAQEKGDVDFAIPRDRLEEALNSLGVEKA